jgi:hypothetical protein
MEEVACKLYDSEGQPNAPMYLHTRIRLRIRWLEGGRVLLQLLHAVQVHLYSS